MKRVSQRTWGLVQSLYSGRGFWDRLLGKMEPPLWAFEEIAASGEAQVIPYLLDCVRSSNADVQRTTALAMGKLFASVEAADYASLDDLTRSALAYESKANSAWRNLKPSEVASLAHLPCGNLVVGLATFHNNGYVREAAVKELSQVIDGSEMPFLLVRLNDWVAEVRAEALRVVLAKICPDYVRHFLRNLRLVDRLRRCGRGIHTQVIQAIEELLKRPEAIPLLREGIASTDRWLRRQCFQLTVASKTASSFELLKSILSDADPILRLWAARSLLPELSEGDLRTLVPALRRDPFMPVRCEALNALAGRLPDIADTELRDALFDPHASVRAAARYHLEHKGTDGFRKIYLEALHSDDPKASRAAIAGLGETGQPEDAELLKPFLTVSPVRLRMTALRSIAALDGDHYLNELLSALKDDHPGVSKTAKVALERRLSLLDLDSLWRTFAEERRLHVRKNVLCLLFRLPTWSRLRFIIMACVDANADIVGLARKRLQDWRQRSASSTPTNRDLQTLEGLLGEYGPRLDQDFVREMRFWMQGFK